MTTVVKDTAAEGLAENMQFVLDKKVMVFASNDTPNTMDPSFMKTFRLDGQWMVPGSYVSEDGRGEVLKMDWSEEIQVTNAAAGKLINDQ
jgi:ATP-dependent 26S proteasome regulatory subunit